MAQLKNITLDNMRKLHAELANRGPLCISVAAKHAGLNKGSSLDWMNRLISLGCVIELPRGQVVGPRNNARYYAVTNVPVPDSVPVAPEMPSSSGVCEFKRTIRKAVNLGLKRDEMLTAFFGEKRV